MVIHFGGRPQSISEIALASPRLNKTIRYEPDERCSPLVALGVGAQGITLVIAPTVLIVAITILATGQGESYLTWSVFAALIIVGIVISLQAAKIGRLGGGHILITGVTPNFIAVSVLALDEGGPSMLASLIVLSSLFYLAVVTWLPLLRRIITPVVSGSVLMLIAALILPICFDRLSEVPEGTSTISGPIVAAVTLIVSTLLVLRGPGIWRPLSLLIGIVAGCVAAIPFGLYDLASLAGAPWVGIPELEFPGLEVTPTVGFWALLPMFLIVTLVQAIKSIGDGVVVQQVARRKPRATDFRLIQGSMYATGIGILLSGVAGTPPTTSYSSLSVSLIHLTGVAARSVGYAMGAILLVLAMFPKVTGVLLIIPSPVMGGFLLVAVAMLFLEGIQTLSRAGLNPQKAIVAGLAFSIGLGMENHNVLEDLLGSPWGTLLGNGITIGAATAIALTAFLEFTGPRGKRLETSLDTSNLPQIDAFLQELAGKMGWDSTSTDRLRSAGEETLSSLLQPGNEQPEGKVPRLVVTARPEGRSVELEFVTAFEDENLEDRLAYLDDQTETEDEREISFRLLRHYASSVRHQKYQGMDIVTVRVDG
ncbi:MAG: hypothetical protein F4Y50_04500 [Dehalococcoidia bacterium]|nr:hypothetical protein [Dehalococcoidia bacterium]